MCLLSAKREATAKTVLQLWDPLPFWGGKPYVSPRLLVSLDTICSTLNYGLGEMFIDMTYGEKGRQCSVFASKFDRTLTGPVGLLLFLVFLALFTFEVEDCEFVPVHHQQMLSIKACISFPQFHFWVYLTFTASDQLKCKPVWSDNPAFCVF